MFKPFAVLAAVAASAVLLAGCEAVPTDNSHDGVVRVVASTNVYGDLAATVGGSRVAVTSIIEKAQQDPHEFEANGRVQLALFRADLVIENGGGYDDFVDTMLDASGNSSAAVLNAVKLSGKDASLDGFNEHVFYDYDAMIAMTSAIAAALGTIDPAHGKEYIANAGALTEKLQNLGSRADTLSASAGGRGVIITEPVPLYLLSRIGLDNLTPPAFSEAIEQDTDIPPALLRKVLDKLDDGSAALVVYNAQTGGPQTDAILAAAKKHGVPTVGVTEILPVGESYVSWQRDVLDAISRALEG